MATNATTPASIRARHIWGRLGMEGPRMKDNLHHALGYGEFVRAGMQKQHPWMVMRKVKLGYTAIAYLSS